MSHVTCHIPYLKYLDINTYRLARYAICTYTWHTGMHQTQHGNYRSHACGLWDGTSKHGNHDCGIAMYWQEAPSVETGVLLAEW